MPPSSAASAATIPVDDELEAATRFHGSEEDEDDLVSVVEVTGKEVTTEIWRKADGCESNPATELPDMAL